MWVIWKLFVSLFILRLESNITNIQNHTVKYIHDMCGRILFSFLAVCLLDLQIRTTWLQFHCRTSWGMSAFSWSCNGHRYSATLRCYTNNGLGKDGWCSLYLSSEVAPAWCFIMLHQALRRVSEFCCSCSQRPANSSEQSLVMFLFLCLFVLDPALVCFGNVKNADTGSMPGWEGYWTGPPYIWWHIDR